MIVTKEETVSNSMQPSTPMADVTAIVPAAGIGKRFDPKQRKQYMLLGHKPVLAYVLDVLEAHPRIGDIVVVMRQEDRDALDEILVKGNYDKVLPPVMGGAERQDSVYNALRNLQLLDMPAFTLVHDGVRPFINSSLITRCIDGIAEHDGAIAAVPPKDTIKRGREGFVEKTLDRSTLWSVQTPQVFRTAKLLDAYERAMKDDYYATDDSALVERIGGQVNIVPGYYENIKVTTPEDMEVAEAIIKRGFKWE